uniref:Proteasome subunit beta n=1 Tax=Spongospora subterranea TaxID=70186 RepID=A0A0H5RJS9_9EUKA|eukprot:CRZ08964.1 hypothetical protein [Spongospora subterranea]
MLDFGANTSSAMPTTHTQSPIVTGASVLGVVYADGVMIMADTLGSYGSMARFRDLKRIRKINDSTLVGASGEYSDFQEILEFVKQLTVSDWALDDGNILSSSEIFSFLTRKLYNHRSKVNPLWNQLLIAGFDEGKGLLGYIDLYGTSYKDNVAATGFGCHLGIPILRKGWRPNLTEAEARSLLEDAHRVLLYRDCRGLNKFQVAVSTAKGVEISEPFSLKTEWKFRRFVNPDDIAI